MRQLRLELRLIIWYGITDVKWFLVGIRLAVECEGLKPATIELTGDVFCEACSI